MPPRGDRSLSPIEAAERQRALLLRVVRLSFFVLTLTFSFLALLQVRETNQMTQSLAITWWVPVLFALALFVIALAIDIATPKKKLSTIAGVFFGVLGGMVATIALGFLVDLLLESWVANPDAIDTLKPIVNSIKILLGIALCYLGISTVLQTQDDFRLVIPYVEFAKQLRGVRPLVLDTSCLIDARIVDIAQTNFLLVPLVIPRFVLDELQRLSDSADPAKRVRGRRGLDSAQRLQRIARLDVTIDESHLPAKSVDQMLIELAKSMPALVVTSDIGLARNAQIQGVGILNLNDLANALKPSLLPGSTVSVRLIRQGEQPTQGVGYLDDGTMVVAEDGVGKVGQTVTLTVTGALQTSGGRLIFARVADAAEGARDTQRKGDGAEAGSNQFGSNQLSTNQPSTNPSNTNPSSTNQAAMAQGHVSGQDPRLVAGHADGPGSLAAHPSEPRDAAPVSQSSHHDLRAPGMHDAPASADRTEGNTIRAAESTSDATPLIPPGASGGTNNPAPPGGGTGGTTDGRGYVPRQIRPGNRSSPRNPRR